MTAQERYEAYRNAPSPEIEPLDEGSKNDSAKERYELLPADALLEVVKVYTFGANKYDDRNWEKGIRYSRIIGAIKRHIAKYELGQTQDYESSLHHLAHAAFGCLSLIAFDKRGMRETFNDLPQLPNADKGFLES